MTSANPARDQLALALDFSDIETATTLARQLSPYFSVAKIGLELYSSAGPQAIQTLSELGYKIFCDLKLHDIPNTVHKAAHAIGKLGVTYLTIHTSGGEAMLAAGVEGFTAGAANSQHNIADPCVPNPCVLGVTVLTSDPHASKELLTERIQIAAAAGCGGVVCAAPDLPVATQTAPDLKRVVPGIRMPNDNSHDQSRIATPQDALAAGANLLVIGRSVTAAPDPLSVALKFAALCG